MKNLTNWLLALLMISLPCSVIAQNSITVDNLQYDYNPDTGVMKNFQFDIVYNGEWPSTGFSVWINFFDVDRSTGPIVIDGMQGLGGTGEGTERRTIKFQNNIDLNEVDDLYNGTFNITIYIPDYRENVYQFDDSEDNTIIYKTGEDYSTGIEDKPSSSNSAFHLFPNPVKQGDEVTLKMDEPNEIEELAVYTMQGKRVYQKSVDAPAFNVPVNRLAPGIYGIKVKHSEGAVVKRLVVTE